MAQIILVTSFKGGVGKTTVSANIAASLAKRCKKVIACDCDLESRCLDLVLGVENQPLFNICDVALGRCSLESAITTSEKNENLDFMPAPAFYPEAVQTKDTDEIFTEDSVSKLVKELSKRYQYIIFDLPARPDMLYRQLVKHANTVLVVSLHTSVSIRSAEKTAIAITELCEGHKTPDIRLVVNSFRAAGVKNGINLGLYDILSQTKLPLAGVIPYDSDMANGQEKGRLSYELKEGKLGFWRAIKNITGRLLGENIKLLSGIKTNVKKEQLY